MGQAEYIVRFKGDYSALQKDINKIAGETKKISDDEVIIKLAYDGNIKEFNKVFNQISEMHPELGIQFQYNVNEKVLKQELDKLEKLSDLKLDIDESKVSGKLIKLADNIEGALKEGMSKNEIARRVSEFFGYYNTAVKAGAKNIDSDFDSINYRLYDLFKNQAEEIKDIYDEIFDSNDRKKIELFRIDNSLNDDLVKTKERVDDLRNALKSLEEKGASKSGLPSELQKVQDEIKILRADIDSMKGELKNLSGDAFDDMTEQIKGANEQLNYTLQTLTNLKRVLASNDIKIKNSIGGVVKQWQSEEETKSYERYTAFNSQTKETSGAHLAADATGVSMKLMKTAIAELGVNAEGTIHSHPMKNAAFSDDDIERYISLFEETQGKIFLNSITSAEQAMTIDMRKVDISKKDEIVQTIKDSYEAIDAKYLGNLQLSVNEIKEDIMPLLNLKAGNPIVGSVIKTIRENFDDLFDGITNLREFREVFEDNADYILKQIPELKQLSKEDRGNIIKNVGGYIDVLHDSILDTVSEKSQKEYQRVLQEVFEKPEFLKSGETSAIKLEALTDFIDWGSIEDSAIEATKKAGDAVKKAQDSNSPAELTKPLGKDFGLGYAEGIREAMPEIVEACKEIVLAAYDAVKEANDAKNGEGNNFLDNFINNLKESLDNAAPTIQEKIKEVFSKINIDNISEESSLSSITSEDFKSQFQNAIDETGRYIIKVYGELIDDFKSRLQNSIDETGIYHVDIEGWLYDTFHDGLQRDIDGQEKYIIEVKGRLFDSFKEVLQEAIENLGAFPIEVKPYMRKGGEIEEVDLPGDNHNNLLSEGATAPSQETTNQARQGLAEMREETEKISEKYKQIYELLQKICRLSDMLENSPTYLTNLKNLPGQFLYFGQKYMSGNRDLDTDQIESNIKGAYGIYTKAQSKFKAGEYSQKEVDNAYKTFVEVVYDNISHGLHTAGNEVGTRYHLTRTLPKKMQGFIDQFIDEYFSFNERNNSYHNELFNKYGKDPDETLKSYINQLAGYGKGLHEETIVDDFFADETIDDGTRILNLLNETKVSSNNVKDILEQICKILEIDIPKAAQSSYDSMQEISKQSDANNLLSEGATTPSQQFDNTLQKDLVYLENYKNTIEEINQLKLQPKTDETEKKLQELQKLADYFFGSISIAQSEWGNDGGNFVDSYNINKSDLRTKGYGDAVDEIWDIGRNKPKLNVTDLSFEFEGIGEEISRIESKSESLRQRFTKDLAESRNFVEALTSEFKDFVEYTNDVKTEQSPSMIEAYNKDIEYMLQKFPVLEQFRDKFTSRKEAHEFVKTDEWNDFLATLPQTHTYLESIGYDFDKINRVSNETPSSTLSTEAETKALLSKKEVVEQLRAELNLTKKAAEDLFDQQGYAKTNNKYQIEQTAVDELITSLKEKKQVEESQDSFTTSPTANAMQSEVEAVNQAIDAEKKKFDELKNKISKTIPTAINKKNQAFEKERDLVAKVVDDEVDYFDVLKDSINGVTDTIEKQYDTTKNAKPKADKSNNKSSNNKSSSNKSNEPDKDALLQQHYVDLRKDTYQSFGQKSDIQKEMSKYYSQLEKESSDIYSSANKKANGLLDKIKKLNFDKYTQDFIDELKSAESELTDFLNQLNAGTIPLDKIDEKISVLATNINDTLSKKALGNVKKAGEKTLSNIALKIDQIIAKNSAMGKQYEDRFKGLRKELEEAENVDVAKRIIADVNQLESEIINAGKTGVSFIDQIKQRLRDMNSKYIAQYFSFQDIIRYARQAGTNVVQLNDAFIELSKVSNTSLEDLESDFQSYANTAKDIGGTITDTISATADWSRLGYNVPDSKELAEVAMLYKNVGDGIDINTANESLISTLRGFKMEADDAISVVDKFNEVSNNFAISSGGIGESLQRSAAAFSAANTDLSQSIALITATNEIVQDPDAVGSMWTTVSARIRGAKSELEDMGEDTEDMVESTSKLRDLVKGITGVDIMLDENTFKDIYTIITQIGDKWNEISDIDQAALLEALAGKRQANRLAAVLGNLDHLKEAYQTAEESAGSARREQENFEKGITYSVNQAKATLEELSYDAIDSDFLKGLINTGTKLLEIIDKIIDKFGLFKSLIVGGAAVLGSQKLG